MRNLIVCTHQILLARSNQEHATLVEENSYSGLVFQLKVEKFNCPINLSSRVITCQMIKKRFIYSSAVCIACLLNMTLATQLK